MSTFVKLIIGVIAFLVYGSTVFYGCGVVDDCLESRKSKIMASLAGNPALEGISVDTDSCGKVTMSGLVGSQETKDAAIAACDGCGWNLDASGIIVQSTAVAVKKGGCLLKASFDKAGRNINISGSAPDDETKQNIISSATNAYGSEKVGHQLEDCDLSDEEKNKFASASVAAIPQLTNFVGDSRLEVTESTTQFWGDVRDEAHVNALDQIKSVGANYHVVYEPLKVVELDKNDCQDKLNTLLANEKIQFNTGNAEISTDSDSLLIQLESTLAQCDKLSVIIEGHTDTRGSEANNQSLSERRANAVMSRLYDLGLSQGRASAIGMGESNPIADESTAEGLAANRRIEFKLQGEQ